MRVLWHCQAPREWSLSGLLLRGEVRELAGRRTPQPAAGTFAELFRLRDAKNEPQRLDVVKLDNVGLRMFQIHLDRRNGPRFCVAEVFAFGPSGKVVVPAMSAGSKHLDMLFCGLNVRYFSLIRHKRADSHEDSSHRGWHPIPAADCRTLAATATSKAGKCST